MGNSLRCCLACVLPCGALDVVRIVHLNGHVEEYGGPVQAGKILAANPHHVLSTPCSSSVAAARKILIVSAEAELKRGQIYFLIPKAAVPPPPGQKTKPAPAPPQRRKQKPTTTQSESHLSEALPESKNPPCHRRRRSGRVGAWRPHLDSIAED